MSGPEQSGYCPQCEKQVVAVAGECPDCHSPVMSGNPDDLEGKVIDGRYTIVSRLGKGGMGVVYRARQKFLDREVALKVLRTDLASDTLAVRRFLQEARSASGLRNPHTVTVYEFGVTPDGLLYFTMELLKGRSVRDELRDGGPISPERAVRIVSQACESLAEAHAQGIWHRDLKPDNIFLVSDSEDTDFVKILDFGIAKASNASTQLTSTGVICGTPQYMSPEQARGEALDNRSDLYALGIVLFEMLTGVAPFDGNTPIQVLMGHLMEPVPSMASKNPGVQIPEALEHVVLWTLCKNASGRPANAGELARALQAALEPGGGTVIGNQTRNLRPPVVPVPVAEPVEQQPPPTPHDASVVAMSQIAEVVISPTDSTSTGAWNEAVETKPAGEPRGRKVVWVAGLAALVVVLGVVMAVWRPWQGTGGDQGPQPNRLNGKPAGSVNQVSGQDQRGGWDSLAQPGPADGVVLDVVSDRTVESDARPAGTDSIETAGDAGVHARRPEPGDASAYNRDLPAVHPDTSGLTSARDAGARSDGTSDLRSQGSSGKTEVVRPPDKVPPRVKNRPSDTNRGGNQNVKPPDTQPLDSGGKDTTGDDFVPVKKGDPVVKPPNDDFVPVKPKSE